MEDYLEKHNVATILKSLVAQLCIVRPEQPVPFMIDYLRKNFVDTAAPALPSKTSFAPPTAVEQKSAPMDTEHDDEEEEDEDRETHEAPKKEVGAPRRRGGISAEAYGDEEDKEPLPPSVPKGKEINERLESTLKEGEVIVRQGERGDIFYIILEGEVSVTQKQSDGVTREVARLKTSDYFGEIALLTERPRAATVTSVGPVRCVQLDRARFNRVMGPCEDILRRNMEEYNKFMATNI
eukprot:TRINITY_DN6303_c0_g1_i2.p1 TRINITY_DN6303_c0_g1~~TRINITY_DN6303_c0_g1_i2.p1  ORF type:complete len:238 (+),score=24.19 TRINITY_DN6303_c0_g1_i2:38-751(+)